MNNLTILGNLTREPETKNINTRSGGNTSVTNFSLAVNEWRNGEQKTEYFRCTTWGRMAENAYKFLHQGSKVCVRGPVHGRQFQKRDGTSGFVMEVDVQDMDFCDRKPGDNQAHASAPATGYSQENFTQVETDELPF